MQRAVYITLLFIVASLNPAAGWSGGRATAQPLSIVPLPTNVERGAGQFTLDPECRVLVQPDTAELRGIGQYLAERLATATGLKLTVSAAGMDKTPAHSILLSAAGVQGVRSGEAYELVVTPDSIVARGTPHGLLYAVQTIRQLLPPELEQAKHTTGITWTIPAVRIEDTPRFAWRGLLLDVARHFRDKEFVKRYIDLLAYHKMNVLHWHLVDDQGWRIEIKKYPRLTSVGAWREQEGGRYGGFYTQDEIREVVAYAAKRYITVVPEIEMPGHCNAALAAYPQFSCTGGPFKVPSMWGVLQDVYCAGNDETYAFNEDILSEVLELFPSKWIHIGGDEVDFTRWKTCKKCQKRIADEHLKDEHHLQSYFIHRIDTFLQKKGRRLIGWDEILDGGLAPGATVQSWRGMDGAIAACKMDHDVIISPTSHCYLDYSLVTTSLEQSYSLDPVPPEIKPEQARHVLGVEGNIWSERTPLPKDTDRQVFPRLCAVAEVGWSPKDARNFTDFSARMQTHLRRLKIMGIQYGDIGKLLGRWLSGKISQADMPIEWDASAAIGGPGRYELSLWYEKGEHALKVKSATILEDGKEVARDAHAGWTGAATRNNIYAFNLRSHRPGVKYTVRIEAHGDGGTDSTGSVWMKRVEN